MCASVFSCGRATLVPQTPPRDPLQPGNNGCFNSSPTRCNTHPPHRLLVFVLNLVSSSLISWSHYSLETREYFKLILILFFQHLSFSFLNFVRFPTILFASFSSRESHQLLLITLASLMNRKYLNCDKTLFQTHLKCYRDKGTSAKIQKKRTYQMQTAGVSLLTSFLLSFHYVTVFKIHFLWKQQQLLSLSNRLPP